MRRRPLQRQLSHYRAFNGFTATPVGDILRLVFRRLFTLGHSNHSIERFLELAAGEGIEVIADVRSQPYSKYSPQFSYDSLPTSLAERSLQYVWVGRELGGRPEGAEFYDADGHVLYERVAQTPEFDAGLKRLLDGAERYRIGVMCAEEDPVGCHRHRLVARVLEQRGHPVWHIRGDGRLERAADLDYEPQLSLFGPLDSWKSIPSVLPKRARNASSNG